VGIRSRLTGRRPSRRVLAIVASVSLLALIAAGWLLWRQHTHPVDATWQRVQHSGVLRVGLDASYPPFECVDEDTGEILGYDVDLARLIGKQLGTEVEVINSGFDGLYPALKMGRFDCVISAFPHDPLLTRDVSFSMAYFQAGLALVTRDGEVTIGSIEDLRERTLAVEWGAQGDVTGRDLRRRLESLTLVPYATPDDALQAVEQGQADAALVDAVSAYEATGARPSLRIAQERVTDEAYVIVVPLDSPLLLAAINEALAEFHEDGTLIRLRDKWF
jgi:ABC-type amino acid transport substrate-binding protein